jgi:predicted SAM-dependent methyltransferase
MTPERFSFFAFPVYPSQFCRKVFPVTRQDVALVDCMGRTSTAFVENCVDVFYLERCWKEFLDVIGALKGDHTLFEFTAARTFKVAVFDGKFGWQKYPYVDAQHQHMVLNPRKPSKSIFEL